MSLLLKSLITLPVCAQLVLHHHILLLLLLLLLQDDRDTFSRLSSLLQEQQARQGVREASTLQQLKVPCQFIERVAARPRPLPPSSSLLSLLPSVHPSQLLLLAVFPEPPLSLLLAQHPGWFHPDRQTAAIAAELTVLSGLQVDVTALGAAADIGARSLVLDGPPEGWVSLSSFDKQRHLCKPKKGSAREASHGTVVDVLGCWLVTHLVAMKYFVYGVTKNHMRRM